METTTAREIMSTEVLRAYEGMPVEECLRLLVNSRITGLPVVNLKDHVIGVVSEYDLIVQLSGKGATAPQKRFSQPIRYTKNPECVKHSATLDAVVKTFVKHKVRRLPVVDEGGKLVGIITRRDLMRLFYYRAKLA